MRLYIGQKLYHRSCPIHYIYFITKLKFYNMKLRTVLLTSALIGGTTLFTACNNDDEMSTMNSSILTPQTYLNITYKGITYKNVPTAYKDNGEFIFLDENFSKLYNEKLALEDSLSTFVTDEHNVTFYDNLYDALEAQKISFVQNTRSTTINTRQTHSSYSKWATLDLYDDKDFKDRQKNYELNDTLHYKQVINLKSYGFNDKCSSLVITNLIPNDPTQSVTFNGFVYPCNEASAVFIGYDDKAFSDRTIVCVADAGTVKKYASLPGFNDKLSSFKFFMAQKGQYSSSI